MSSFWGRARSLFSGGEEKVKVGSVFVDSVMDRDFVAAGQAFKPVDLLGFIRDAEKGDMRRLYAFYEEMRSRDAHLDGELSKAEDYLTGARIDILPYPPLVRMDKKGGDAKKATDIAKYIEEQVFSPSVRIDQAILALMGGKERGVGGFQVQVEPGKATGGKERLASLTPIPGQRWRYQVDSTTLCLQQTGDPQSLVPVESLGSKVVYLVGDGHVPNPARRGILRRCMSLWILRAYGPQWWSRYVELFGSPMRIGRYNPGDKEQEARIREALEKAGSSAWAALPEGAQIEFVQAFSSSSQASPHEFLIDWAGREMSKVILGATQGTDVQRNTGSRASAQVHHDVTIARSAARATEIAAAIREQLLKPLVERNFGKEESERFTPEIRIRVESKPDLYNLAQSLKTLVEAGVKTIPVSWVHDIAAIPVPDGEEAVLDLPLVPGDPRAPMALRDKGVGGNTPAPNPQVNRRPAGAAPVPEPKPPRGAQPPAPVKGGGKVK